MENGKDQHSPVENADFQQWVGRTATRKFEVTVEMISEFVALSGDRSPIHVDDAFARKRGLKKRVMHGALQGSLVSNVIGNDLPGASGILQELSLKFRKPCYAGDTLSITVTVKEAFESVRTIVMGVRIINQNGELVTTGKAQSGVVEQ